MWVKDEIRRATRILGARVSELSDDEARTSLAALDAAFGEVREGPLWERARDSAGYRHADAWRLLGAFVDPPATLLVEDAQGTCAFRFERVEDLEAVLAECSGFEFYVTDDDKSYFVAFNHHDVLVGAGEAAGWIARLQSGTRE